MSGSPQPFCKIITLLEVAIAAGAAAGAVGLAGYAGMAPQSQLYGATFTRGSDPKQLALTYDDGPNDPHTLRLLDVLAKHEVKATFFMIGRYVRQRPNIVRAVAAAGHAIGNHTFTHPNLIFRTRAELEKELRECRNALDEVVPQHSNLFRPPFGGRRPVTLRIVRAEGLAPIMWSVTCFDWKATTADRVERHATRQIRGGDVILLHDGGHLAMGADRSHTVEATDRLLRRYKDQGFEFVTVSAMLKA